MGEREWVILVQTCIEEEIEEEDRRTPVAIFSVPEALVSGKPEAYVPQIFAFGPYHHWLPKLYDMERHKIAAARRTMSRAVQQGGRIQDLVEQLMKREHKIRSYYQRNINHSMETIAWMMVVDASFLLEFLQNYTEKNREAIRKKLIASARSRRADLERMKMGYNMVLRDIVMLENQIPLYVLRKLTKFLGPAESADSELSEMLSGFADEVSPFKTMDADQPVVDDVVRHAHLLELLYYTIVPKQKELVEETTEDVIDADEEEGGDDHEVEPKEVELGDTSHVKSVYNLFKNLAPGLGGPLIGSIRRAVVSGPVRLLVKLPWKLVTALPIFSIIKQPVESYFSNMVGREKSDHKDQSSHIDRPPLVEEIAVPSVADLVDAGVDFRPTAGGITSIAFDAKTVTMHLPVVTLDVNTEVLLRNLVAYEASAVSGPLVFTRS
ncbi:putative UPF0481 protein [Iris pallida]|uniref:UPF0481 protein n=1 Tax=Iris pallida TaxID=29817 RepID=A0AAX6GLZ0_IRIPA|nr:putative UPF0481 protein [Iris pallida]